VIDRKTFLPFLGGLLLASACILSPTAATEEPADTPAATDTIPAPTAEPTPAPTNTPTLPVGLFPIAVSTDYNPGSAVLLGGAENGAWVSAADAAVRLSGGETYMLYSLDGPQGTTIGSQPAPDMICPQYYMQWNPAPSVPSLIGVGGGWNALPRMPKASDISDYPVYAAAVGAWLASQGMPVPDPLELANVTRADLDGDGSLETVISASRFIEPTGHDVGAGDFSTVLLYRESDAETIQLAGDVYPAARSLVFPRTYSLLAIADLNGDGRMEVIVHVDLWEGEGFRVLSYDGSAAYPVFDTSCSL
jgi:hypothetical protein